MPLCSPLFVILLSFIRTVLIKAVYSIMLRRLRNDPFVFVMDFPTNNDAIVLSSFSSHTLSRTGIFHVLFALFSLTLTNTILQIPSYHSHHTRSNPFRLLTQFTENKKTHVLNSRRSRHNIYTTTGSPFQDKTKHKLYSIKPPARLSTTTPPPGSENPPYRSAKSSPRHHLLVCLLEP